MKSFLTSVVDHIIEQFDSSQWGHLTIVLPMQRAGLYMERRLRQHVLEQGRETLRRGQKPAPVLMPRFTTINSLIDQLSGLNPDDEIRSVCQLYTLYKQLVADIDATLPLMPLELFYNWGKQLLTDFGNLDKSGIDPLQVLQNTTDAQVLDNTPLEKEVLERLRELFPIHLRQQAETDSARKQFEQLWKILPTIYTRVQQEQQSAYTAYPGARLRYAVEHPNEWQEQVRDRQFIFVGFNYLQENEKRLMRLLRACVPTYFYWDYRPEFRTNPVAYHFLRQNTQEFGNALPDEEATPCRTIHAVATTSTNVQAQYVRRWLQERRDEKGSFAIVIADEALLEPVLYAIPEEFAPRVNITKGYPLRSTRIYAGILRWLDEKQLRHPDTSAGDALAEMLRTLLVLPDEVPNEDLFGEEEEEETITWQEQLVQESVAKARSVIARLQLLWTDGILTADNCSLHTLSGLIKRQLENETISFAGEPITDIQIIGVLETRLLDFDHLLILGLEEGILPSTPADHSFIPYYLRKYYGLQTNDEGAWAYAYNFFRLLRRSEDVTLLFSDNIDAGHRGMSRFMMQIMTTPEEFQVVRQRIEEDTTLSAEPTANTALSIPADYRFSCTPSAITTYLQCPRRFYYANVLGLRETEKPDAMMQTNELGRLTHSFIQAAYQHITHLKNRVEVTPEQINAFLKDKQAVSQALTDAYTILNRNYLTHHPDAEGDYYIRDEHPIENEVAELHMRKVLQNDAARGPFVLVSMESKHYAPLRLDEETTLSIGGEIDRLDIITENGREYLRIVDYKTGKYDPDRISANELQQLFAHGTHQYYMLQTLIYCWVCSQETSAQAYPIMPTLLYTGMDLERFDPHLLLKGQPIQDFATISPDFIEQLRQLLLTIREDVRNGSFAQCDEKECRAYCPFLLLCNRHPGEW